MGRLGAHHTPTDMRALVQRALDAVQPMARLHEVSVHVDVPTEAVVVSADPEIARQVLISAISEAVSQAESSALSLTLTSGREKAQLSLRYRPGPGASTGVAHSEVIGQLVSLLGWTVVCTDEQGGDRTVVLCFSAQCPTVLVIDDNEGLVELLDVYLSGQACQVVAALSGPDGLSLAQETVPDAIVLDVMLPGMDGWELLQRLQNHPQTASIPIIVCSVIDNPELAYALGASLFVPKPVSRSDVLDALRQLGVV
jgi:CheY-like chemotaxis protein